VPVGPPAWWVARSNVTGGCEAEDGALRPLARKGRLSAGDPEFLVTPLLIGPICLIVISQRRFEELSASEDDPLYRVAQKSKPLPNKKSY